MNDTSFAPFQTPKTGQGYHNKPEETAAAFGLLGGKRFFRTGDLGTLTREGFLTITGRLKELYKLVSPSDSRPCLPLALGWWGV